MLALIDRGEPHEVHPANWAPFVVVGEGAELDSNSIGNTLLRLSHLPRDLTARSYGGTRIPRRAEAHHIGSTSASEHQERQCEGTPTGERYVCALEMQLRRPLAMSAG